MFPHTFLIIFFCIVETNQCCFHVCTDVRGNSVAPFSVSLMQKTEIREKSIQENKSMAAKLTEQEGWGGGWRIAVGGAE